MTQQRPAPKPHFDNTAATQPLFETNLPLPDRRRGKVRDVYALPAEDGSSGGSSGGGGGGDADDRILIVATDRISAFDVVMPTPIPGKGRLLTEVAAFWLGWIEDRGLSRTHLLSTSTQDLPADAQAPVLEGRITIGKRCDVVPVECVVRGYLEGGGWRDYQRTGEVCGIQLPKGLRQCDRLPEPVFTPATKAPDGEHDENISFADACELVGVDTMTKLREASLVIYNAAAAYALDRGIIIADTKFEFGFDADDQITLVDEALTPDSSRFWPADSYEPGHAQPSFDKQFVREFLEGLVDSGTWDKTDPGPELPGRIVQGTFERYREARDRLIDS